MKLPALSSAVPRIVYVVCVNGAGLSSSAALKLVFDATPPAFVSSPSWCCGGAGSFFANSSAVAMEVVAQLDLAAYGFTL